MHIERSYSNFNNVAHHCPQCQPKGCVSNTTYWPNFQTKKRKKWWSDTEFFPNNAHVHQIFSWPVFLISKFFFRNDHWPNMSTSATIILKWMCFNRDHWILYHLWHTLILDSDVPEHSDSHCSWDKLMGLLCALGRLTWKTNLVIRSQNGGS